VGFRFLTAGVVEGRELDLYRMFNYTFGSSSGPCKRAQWEELFGARPGWPTKVAFAGGMSSWPFSIIESKYISTKQENENGDNDGVDEGYSDEDDGDVDADGHGDCLSETVSRQHVLPRLPKTCTSGVHHATCFWLPEWKLPTVRDKRFL